MDKLVDYWEKWLQNDQKDEGWWSKKRELCDKRGVSIVRFLETCSSL